MRLEAIPLSNLASVKSGGGAPQDPSAFTKTGFPFVRAGSLPKLLDGEDEGSLEQLESHVAEEHGLSLFPAGTVLFAKSGMSATKGHVYRLKTPAYVVNHLAALIPPSVNTSNPAIGGQAKTGHRGGRSRPHVFVARSCRESKPRDDHGVRRNDARGGARVGDHRPRRRFGGIPG
jgi:hypothetical protein